jgi:hypothetical protein
MIPCVAPGARLLRTDFAEVLFYVTGQEAAPDGRCVHQRYFIVSVSQPNDISSHLSRDFARARVCVCVCV